ncbi:MAG: bifunctional 4-hydroxy-2-oxoglutarate aldolase/2-dehydro-3-deoxy-phosphogluconate aldolase [Armatimonadetes bacterium]|nr:bifunctional 4-hydroxy-2-oxoglutarate aldolase/2-dehydro-3-deoxy-phosphogluconate aldolase [Armatimonadota bacterium]
MSRLFDAYRAFHEQGFIPIFVGSGLDSKMLVEACIKAGMKGIEYTLRRPDAHEMIPWIRENYPDLFLLAGSTLDDDNILARAKKKYPQLLTIAELDAMGVDGFVSMIGWSLESIKKYSSTRIIAPTAMTVTEAFQQMGAGAHLVKMLGSDIPLIKRCRADAAFGYCPILVTGGQTPERIPETIAAGAVLVGSGFDLILNGMSPNVSCEEVANVLRMHLDVTNEARAKYWPDMAGVGSDREAWLNSLPHYHPFS